MCSSNILDVWCSRVVREEANVAAQIHVLTVEIYFNVSLKSMLSDE